MLILPQPDEGIVVQRFVKPGLLDEGIEIHEQIFVRKQRDVGIRRPHYVVHETGCHVAHDGCLVICDGNQIVGHVGVQFLKGIHDLLHRVYLRLVVLDRDSEFRLNLGIHIQVDFIQVSVVGRSGLTGKRNQPDHQAK